MPQVFQQTLWVGGTGEQGEGQEVVWPPLEMRGRARRGSALFRLGIRATTRRLSNAEGSREFKSPSLRHTVWHGSLHYGEAMKSARGARFTRGRGRGECQRQRLSVKIA